MEPLNESLQPFCVTLIDFSQAETKDFDEKLHLASGSQRFNIRHIRSASDAPYPASVIHAIVFNMQSIAQITHGDETVIRTATDLGTCRVYLSMDSAPGPLPELSRFDDFLQRTASNDFKGIATEINSFFQEADQLNRRSTLLAFRDKIFVGAYTLLQFLWPISCIAAGGHVLNVAAKLTGHGIELGTPALRNIFPVVTFFGAFFIVHSIFIVIRNLLFGARIVKKLNFIFVIGAMIFLILATIIAFSIATSGLNISFISFCAVLSIGLYMFYMYARRIRAECTSISQLQLVMADPARRVDTLNKIGGQPFSSASFPFLSFRKQSLFISYMHGSEWSSTTATLVHKWATRHGYQVFLDRSTIPSGTLWRQYLLRSVSECGFFVSVLDGDAEATEWVLAEQAYAALLRKSIGKPRILLLIKNVKKIAQDPQNHFHINYRDLFEMPGARFYGAGILPAVESNLTEEQFIQALEEVLPMGLMVSGGKRSLQLAREQEPSMNATRKSTADDIQLMDRSWRASVLLAILLDHTGYDRDAFNFLSDKSFQWLRSGSTEKKAIGLNTLNYLFKSHQLTSSQNLTDEVLEAFITNASLVVKLSALDFLGTMNTTPNPLTRINLGDVNRLQEFRSRLISQMYASQSEYISKGVYTDILLETSGKTPWEAMRNVISKVDSIHP
jgi:hypothetical protein